MQIAIAGKKSETKNYTAYVEKCGFTPLVTLNTGDIAHCQGLILPSHVFKKVSMHWPVMLKFSNAIFLLQVLFRRSQVFSVLVQAELFTLLL